MQDSDWLFDMVLDLCDKADDLGLKGMSAKLEEALDGYLIDTGHTIGSQVMSNAPVAAIGPTSLSPDSFALGSRRVVQEPSADKVIHFTPRRTPPSVALQALLAARAKTAADTAGEDEDESTELICTAS